MVKHLQEACKDDYRTTFLVCSDVQPGARTPQDGLENSLKVYEFTAELCQNDFTYIETHCNSCAIKRFFDNSALLLSSPWTGRRYA